MQRKLLWGVLILAISYLLVYTFFLNEYWSYKDAMKSEKTYAIKTYLDKYPEGRYVKEVELKLDSVAYFKDVLADSSAVSVEFYLNYCPNATHREDVQYIELVKRPTLPKAKEFMDTYSNSTKKDQVAQIVNNLWDNELNLFQQNLGRDDVSSTKVDFFLNLLLHMKAVNNNKFVIKFSHTTKLKDLIEYPSSVTDLLALLQDIKPTSENVYDLKSNFKESNILQLEDDVSFEIQKAISNVFSTDFFQFETLHSSDQLNASENDIVFYIDYKIQNEEVFEGVPELWTYTQNDIFKGYLLGIDVSFSLNLKNPGNSKTLSFEEKGNPGTEISDIEDFTRAYSIMVSRSFNTFINEMSKDLGLEKDEE
jgi:hypothetical protein